MQINTAKTAEGYNQNANRYEKRWKKYLAHTHQRLLKHLHTKGDDVILDASCGTGLLAQHLISEAYPFKKLVLNDISTDMQQKAKERLGEKPDVLFTQQPVQNLDLEAESHAKVLCLNAFHNYTNQIEVLEQFWHILQPGGKVYLLDWNRSGWFLPVNWMINHWASEYINSRSLEEISHLLSEAQFELLLQKEWYFRYWKFFLIVAQKPSAGPSSSCHN